MQLSPFTHTVLYHGRCPDGLGAAWAVRKILGDRAEYIPMSYDKPPPNVMGRDVIVVDFSFKPMTMRILEEQAKSVLLLDHHATAKDMLADYKCFCKSTHLEFDMDRSGAMMAWNHFHPGKEPPPLIRHIQDRDIWTWKDPLSMPFLRQLDMMPLTFAAFDDISTLDEKGYQAFVDKGKGLCEQFNQLCMSFVDIAQPLEIDGIQGAHVSASSDFTSDVGNLLSRKTGTFACVWYVQNLQTVKVSLRSLDDTDAGELAVRFGGGGHKHAASFFVPIERLKELVSGKLLSPMYSASIALGDVANTPGASSTKSPTNA